MLNMPEIVLLVLLAVLLFGAKKLPELARGFGLGIKEFKKATREVTDEIDSATDLNAPANRPALPREQAASTSNPANATAQAPRKA